MQRLFIEADHAVGLIDADDAEAVRVDERDLDGGQGGVRVSLEVKPEHLRVVHLVDVVGGQHDDVARRLALDRIQVLKHGVGGAEIPVLADALLGRQNLDELAQLLRHHVPSHPDVPVEGERFVLGGDEDPAQPRIDAVAEGEIDDAVRPAEVHGGFRAFFGQGVETLAGTAGEKDDEDVVQVHVGPVLRDRAH